MKVPLIRFQHAYYPLFALGMGFVVPTVVCGLGWGDWWGGYFLAGVARLVFVYHSTFFVNSLAHYAGAATYTDQHSARNSWITAVLTLGEGYHNFHHEFPNDYRNGIEWYQYDPTKLFIAAAAALGLATQLRQWPHNDVQKGVLQMQLKALEAEREAVLAAGGTPSAALERRRRDVADACKALSWGPAAAELPSWTAERLARDVAAAAAARAAGDASAPVLLVLDGFVLDMRAFLSTHPGGARLLLDEAGKDVTVSVLAGQRAFVLRPAPSIAAALTTSPPPPYTSRAQDKFKGEVYKHSNAAINMQAMYRVARLQGYWDGKQ